MSAQSASLCPSVVARGVCILPCDVTVKTHLSKTTKSNRHANQSCTEQSLSSSLPVRNQLQRRFHCFSLSLQINRSWTSMKKVLKVVTFNQKQRKLSANSALFSIFERLWLVLGHNLNVLVLSHQTAVFSEKVSSYMLNKAGHELKSGIFQELVETNTELNPGLRFIKGPKIQIQMSVSLFLMDVSILTFIQYVYKSCYRWVCWWQKSQVLLFLWGRVKKKVRRLSNVDCLAYVQFKFFIGNSTSDNEDCYRMQILVNRYCRKNMALPTHWTRTD